MASYVPAVQSGIMDEIGNTKTVGTTLAEVLELASLDGTLHTVIDISQIDAFSLSVHNIGLANDIDQVSIQHSYQADGPWELIDSSALASGALPIAPGEIRGLENVTNRRKYMRVLAKAAAGNVDVRCTLYGTARSVS